MLQGWLMKGYVVSESGLADRDSRKVLRAAGVADAAGCGDVVWLGRRSEHGGWGDNDKDRRDLIARGSPLRF